MLSMIRSPFLRACAILALLAPSALLAQKFAFVSTRDGNREIYVVNFDGSGLTNITNNPGNDGSPQWSPDGKRILFQSDRSGAFQPYVMNADGTGQTKLPFDGELCEARWSYDGRKILLATRYAPGGRAYVANPDGSGLTKVADSGGCPEWSPNGVTIVWVESYFDFFLFDTASQSLVVNAPGFADFIAGPWQWSPDGSQLLVPSYTGPEEGIQLLVFNAAGGSSTVISDTGVAYPYQVRARWSPNGKKILVQSEGGDSASESIYIVNSNGSGLNLKTSVSAVRPGEFESVAWSPDGTKLLFVSDRNGKSEIFVANANGSSPRLLSVTDANDNLASWSPDGSRIFFYSESPGGLVSVSSIKPDGTGRESLSDRFGPGDDFQPFGDFSTDPTPAISGGGVVLANLVPAVNTVSPLSIVSIFGTAFSAGSVFYPNLDSDGKIDTILGGTCVEIGGERAPIFAMTPKQANVQMPSALTVSQVGVVVIRNCGKADELRSAAATITVEEATPAFFLYPPYEADGLIAARFNDGYAAVSLEGTISDGQGPSRPAKPGDIILLFGTGWGRTEADLSTGERGLGADPLHPSANPMVTFGGIPLAAENILYVGSTPEAAGLYQLTIRVPATALPGDNQVVLTVYGKSTPAGPVVTVAAP